MSKARPVPFSVLVPVKPTRIAKSRLAALGDRARRDLVAAFAADTVSAALDSRHVGCVLVVTDDHVLAATLRGLGAHVLPDATTDDLNESLSQAAAEALRRWPERRLAALCADLPSLDPAELDAALEVAAGFPSAFVADASGEGTTMVAAASREEFAPRFGSGSCEAHAAQGAHHIVEVDVPTLRRDVDTPHDLAQALELGVGAHTARAARGLSL
ncbi:MAG TPA: 2-phospho-L-lactate guanylyltransferase [Nocardioidaceae bacterium]|nr:2-phospho-L-lactate guanylyltransferase [Nocardioidaceae bacterium]